MITLWSLGFAALFWIGVMRRRRRFRADRIVNVTEGRHRPVRGGGF